MITFLFVISAFAWSSSNCEPPVNNYLPPSNGASGGRPPLQYGPPGSEQGRPEINNGRSGQNGNNRQPQNTYGTPGDINSNQGFRPRSDDFDRGLGRSNTPSSQYGAPNSNQQSQGNARPQTNYGAPNRRQGSNGGQGSQAGGRNSNLNTPNNSYGAPQFGQPNGNAGLPIIEGFQPPPNTAEPVPPTPLRGYEDSYEDRPPMTGFNSRLRGGAPPSDSYGAPVFERPGSRSDSVINGQSDSGEQDNEPAKYEFNYDVDDPQTGTQFGHTEQRNGDIATGEYNVLLPDGRKQVVEYEAGHQGFKPQIRYEGGGNGFGAGGTNNEFGGDNQAYPRNSAMSREKENFASGGSTLGYPQGGPNQEFNQGTSGAGQRGRESSQKPSNDFPPFGDTQSSGEMGYPRGGPENEFAPPARGGNYPQNFNGFSNDDSSDPSSQGYPSGRPNSGNFNGKRNNNGQGTQNNGGQRSQGYPSGKPNGNSNGQRTQNNGDRGAQGYPSGKPNNGNFNGRENNNDRKAQGSQGGRGASDGDSGYPSGAPNGARGTGY